MIIDAHVHLWKKQAGLVDGMPVYPLENGRAMLKGEVRQMLPPYMTDNKNTAARLLSNMDFALVSGAVVTQEYMDGNQDDYLRRVRRSHPKRLRVCALYEEKGEVDARGMDGIKLCGGRLKDTDHRYFRCPDCRQTVRVPRGKGKISIRCPKCGRQFIEKT